MGLNSFGWGARPQGVVTLQRNDVALTVGVYNPVLYTFQWLFNSQPIGGATNQSFTNFNLQASGLGDYQMLVSNVSPGTRFVLSLPAKVQIGADANVAARGKFFDVTPGGVITNGIFGGKSKHPGPNAGPAGGTPARRFSPLTSAARNRASRTTAACWAAPLTGTPTSRRRTESSSLTTSAPRMTRCWWFTPGPAGISRPSSRWRVRTSPAWG